jgi:benzoyl-CoA reductase subunit A
VLKKAIGDTGMKVSGISAIAATGWGKKNAAYATSFPDEVHCHMKGARFMYGPEVRTVVDLGAQTIKAIRLYDWDRVRDFMMNDKCATGMGRNIEILCDLLQVPIEEIGEKSLDVEAIPSRSAPPALPLPIPRPWVSSAAPSSVPGPSPKTRSTPLTSSPWPGVS